jgi:predicted CoA-binding protein
MMDVDLSKIDHIAVVGASRDREKFGYKVLMDLVRAGYEACGVNPACDEIEGVACYPELASLPWRPELVITVVPPRVTENVVREAREAGISRVWMQPGSESSEAIAFCEANGIEMMHDACIMIYRRDGVLAKGD